MGKKSHLSFQWRSELVFENATLVFLLFFLKKKKHYLRVRVFYTDTENSMVVTRGEVGRGGVEKDKWGQIYGDEKRLNFR